MSVRSVGNVDLAIGLVSCPVKMIGVIDSHDRKGSMYHEHADGTFGKVKMPKQCEVCNITVPAGEIAKGFEENGEMVMLTASEMETVAANTGASLEVPHFVKAEQIDPMLFANENVYRLIPDSKRGKQAEVIYRVIRTMLVEQGLVGVVQYTRWGRNRLGLLSVEGNTGALVIRNMMWPDELRHAAEVPDDDGDVDPRLMPVMLALAESMTTDWHPSDYADRYTEQLNEAIAAKAAGGEIATINPDGTNAIDDVADLLAKLEASIANKQEAKKAPAKKAPAKKAPARKAQVA